MDITTGGPVHPALKEAFEKHKTHSNVRSGPEFHERSLQQMMNDGCMPAELRRKFYANAVKYNDDLIAIDAWARADFVSHPGMSELWRGDEFDDPNYEV